MYTSGSMPFFRTNSEIHMFFGIPGKTSHPEAPDREYLDALTLTVRAEVRTEYPTEIVSGMS